MSAPASIGQSRAELGMLGGSPEIPTGDNLKFIMFIVHVIFVQE